MNKIEVQGGGFPGTSKTWRFLRDMIYQLGNVTANIAGDGIVSGMAEFLNNVTPGLAVINGEVLPCAGGVKKPYLKIVENVEQTQYLKDENGDGEGDMIDTYFERRLEFTDFQGESVVAFDDLKRLKNLAELSKRIPPQKAIFPFYGSPTEMPEGWQLCDGTNGTPDLSGRFIVGLSNDEDYNQIGKTGGSKRHKLTVAEMPQHNHSGTTDSAGEHTHNYSQYTTVNGEGIDGTWAKSEYRTKQTSSAGLHSHTVKTNNKGGDQPHENRPPYYTLAYITYVG